MCILVFIVGEGGGGSICQTKAKNVFSSLLILLFVEDKDKVYTMMMKKPDQEGCPKKTTKEISYQ